MRRNKKQTLSIYQQSDFPQTYQQHYRHRYYIGEYDERGIIFAPIGCLVYAYILTAVFSALIIPAEIFDIPELVIIAAFLSFIIALFAILFFQFSPDFLQRGLNHAASILTAFFVTTFVFATAISNAIDPTSPPVTNLPPSVTYIPPPPATCIPPSPPLAGLQTYLECWISPVSYDHVIVYARPDPNSHEEAYLSPCQSFKVVAHTGDHTTINEDMWWQVELRHHARGITYGWIDSRLVEENSEANCLALPTR